MLVDLLNKKQSAMATQPLRKLYNIELIDTYYNSFSHLLI